MYDLTIEQAVTIERKVETQAKKSKWIRDIRDESSEIHRLESPKPMKMDYNRKTSETKNDGQPSSKNENSSPNDKS